MSLPLPHAILQVTQDYYERAHAVNGAGEPALMACIPIAISGTSSKDVDVVVKSKFEVVRVECIKRGGAGAGNTMTLKKGSVAITDAIDCETDNEVTSASTIDDATSTLAPGDTLRLSGTRAAGTLDAIVLVWGLIRA